MDHPKPRRPGLGRCLATALIAFALPIAGAAQAPALLPPASALKRMSVDQLMDLVVTSVSKRPEKLSGAASAIQVITGDEIRRSGASRLPEALRLAANLQVAQVDSRQWAITSRGFNNVFAGKMLVLMDGRSVYTPLYAGVYWDVQDTLLADLDRIEVISGPGATQWGANAVNGVINMTTKSARDTQGALVSAGAGGELQTGEVRYGGKVAPRTYYRVYAKYSDRADSVRSNGHSSNDPWETGQVGFRMDGETSAGDVLTWQGDTYNASIDRAGAGHIHATGSNLLGRWTRNLAADSELKLQLYYDRTHRRIPDSFTQDIETYDLDVQHRRPIGTAQALVWGFGYRQIEDRVENTAAMAFLPPRVSRSSVNAFAQDEIAFAAAHVHVTVGSKLEHTSYSGTEFEPSIRVTWNPVPGHTLWSAISRALRTPSRIDRDLFSPATPPYRIAGGEKVVSEKLIAYELGYRVQFEPDAALSLATFVHRYDDLRSLEPLTPPLAFPVETSNGLNGESYGAELVTDWQVARQWRLHAGWTELRVHSAPKAGTADRGTRDSISRDPHRQIFLRSHWDLAAAWEVDLGLRYVAPIPIQALPGYIEADLRFGWRPTPAWELSLLGRNLLHARHAEFNSPGARREMQRAVHGKVSWRF